jgi:HK97 family phage major capsid protein
VWVMSATNALALSLIRNGLGQSEFPGISMSGGTFMGLPVIVSQHIGNYVALVNASDVFLGDEGGVAVDMSREASLEMRSTGLGMDATAGTATAASVSMFQTNSVALRAERAINWKLARPSGVTYLTGVAWGGAVNSS